MDTLSVVGHSVNRVDGLEKALGKADFPSDFQLPNMLHGKIVRSPFPHARIIAIDTSKAMSLPGVKAMITALDTPAYKLGVRYYDRFVFPPDLTVRYVGDAVAAIAAETEEIAMAAAALVKVDYEQLPAVFDTEEAFSTRPPAVVHPGLPSYECDLAKTGTRWRLEPDRPNVCQHFQIRHGDIARGFEAADLIVEDRYFTPRISHCQLEPCVSVAWFEPDGTLRLVSSTQGVQVTKDIMCNAFNLPSSKVRVQARYLGGGFGGKGRTITEPYAVLLSRKLGGRPVRIALTREEHFINARSRVPVVTHIKDGIKQDGRLVARQLRILVDMGSYADIAITIVRNCAFGAVGIYDVPNFCLDSYGVYTDTPMSAPFRGFGSAEVTWAIESQMDVMAEKLGIDAVEIRRRNFLTPGGKDVCGQTVRSYGVPGCLDKVQEWIGWGQKAPQAQGSWKIGKGIALANKYTMTNTPSSAVVKVNADGTIEIHHSSDEIGMGINTVVAQMAAESFGITTSDVNVISGDTGTCPYGWPPVSSRETFHMGRAVLAACDDAKRQLFDLAAARLGVSKELFEVKDKKILLKGHPGKFLRIADLFRPAGLGYALAKGDIVGRGIFELPGIPEDPDTGQSERIVSYYGYGAHAVEVAVDTETGHVVLLRGAACFDSGVPVNPLMCEGQMDGGIAMGLGVALNEEMLIQNGVVLNPNFHDYKVATALDIPDRSNLATMLAGVPHPEGPFGAKGMGEAVMISLPPAISNAIYNAVGVRIKELPMTGEKILQALHRNGRLKT